MEGYLLVAYYLMIVSNTTLRMVCVYPLTSRNQMLSAWFYTGQDEIDALLVCKGVVESLSAGSDH